jgi:AcrR family transcriptional regulator
MILPKSAPPIDSTREVLLATAGRIFARNGYHATTVRQITREAGANLAAVNYHFRDKHELYVCVLKKAHHAAARMKEADFSGTPRQQLRTFIRTFLDYLLDPQRPEWQGRLIARELMEPTRALDRLVAESIQPVRKQIEGIVRGLLGPGVPETRRRMACFSILGQCLYYVHSREMIARLFPQDRDIHRDVETLTEHIFQFSLAGLAALRPGKPGPGLGLTPRKGIS